MEKNKIVNCPRCEIPGIFNVEQFKGFTFISMQCNCGIKIYSRIVTNRKAAIERCTIIWNKSLSKKEWKRRSFGWMKGCEYEI